jgi:hypothetical protein
MERAKIGEDPLRVFQIFHFHKFSSTFNKYKQNCGASEKRDGNATF